jgi:hypothetical protein
MPRDTTPPSFFCLLYFEAICATRLKKSSAQNNRAIRVTVGLTPDGRGCETDIKKPPAFPVKRFAGGWAGIAMVTSPSRQLPGSASRPFERFALSSVVASKSKTALNANNSFIKSLGHNNVFLRRLLGWENCEKTLRADASYFVLFFSAYAG